MCVDPATMAVLSTVSSVASGVAQYGAQAQQAKAQIQAQKEASARLAKKRSHELTVEREAENQRNKSAAMELEQAASEATDQIATIATAGAEGNTAGNTLGLRIDEYKNMELETGVLTEMQLQMERTAQLLSIRGGDLSYTDEWVRNNPAVQGPDLFGTILDTGQQVMGTWQDFSLRQGQRENWARQDSLYEAQLQQADAQTRLSAAQTRNLGAQANLTRLRTQTERLNRDNARLQNLHLQRR